MAVLALGAVVASAAQAEVIHPYTTSFGPGGVGSGSFGEVVGVTVNQLSGDVLVLDRGEGGRLYKFNAAGEPVDFSSTGTNVIEGVGSAPASFDELAVDSSTGPDAGDIYVANSSVVKIYSAAGAPLGELSGGGERCGVAVDPSGNVYVGINPETVKRYAPRTSPVTNADEDGSMGGLKNICNVAVDAAGDVYAATFYGGVNKYDALQFGSMAASGELVDPSGYTLGVDPANGEVFIAQGNHVDQFDGSTAPPARVGTTQVVGGATYGVGVDHESGKLYVGVEGVVQIFGAGVVRPTTEAASGVSTTEATLHGTVEPAGSEVTACIFEYGTEQEGLTQSTPCSPAAPYTGTTPVAVSARVGGLRLGTTYRYRVATTYASGTVVGEERSFVTTGPQITGEYVPSSTLGANDATVDADVNPNGEATTYRVEYGTTSAYGSSTPPVELEGGEPREVSVHIGGLRANTTYHFRFVAANATASVVGPDVEFTTSSIVKDESFSEVGTKSALLSAVIDPGGEATAYLVEYGPTPSYGSATVPISVGAGERPVPVASRLEELQPETTYHFRFVARKNGGSETGPDLVFTTHTPATSGLPDGRVYEKVSPNANADGNVYEDMPSAFATEGGGSATEQPFTISSDGSSIAYPADPSEAGGVGLESGGAGNEFVAHRAPSGGWSAVNEDPPSSGFGDFPVYQGFSADLSLGYLTSSGRTPLAAGAPGAEYASLYARTFADGAYQALLNVKPPHREPEEFRSYGTPSHSPIGKPEPEYAGSSADLSHALFMANDALTANAVDGGPEANNLYDSHEGALTLVNVLPDGSTEPNASFGGPVPASFPSNDIPALDHDISADGSRIFWTDLNTHDLFVRENDTEPQSPVSEGRCTVASDACTVLIADEAQYWDATPDGAKVLYTKGGDLFEYELATGRSTDLATGAHVHGVLGTSDDLSYVYFVADGALAPGARAQQCTEESQAEELGEVPQTNGCNLFAVHVGEAPRFVGALSRQDVQNGLWNGYNPTGDWLAGLGQREAEATPDGSHLLFVSTRPLTGYDNRHGVVAAEQAFVYDFGSAQLSCVSCDRTGQAPPTGYGAYLPPSHMYTSLPHWMSDDGDRVFFDSVQSLVRQDTNNVTDVYEWERDGTGSCNEGPGCIYLISDGTSHEGSFLIGTTSTGDDAFFTTRTKLVGEDENETIDVYDARAGASAPAAPTQCTGAGCQGVPSAPPVFATPASSTYAGVGNLAPAATVEPKSVSKPLTRAQRLVKALKACRKKRQKKKRAACEKQARKSYGAHASAKRSAKRASKKGNLR
jgi:hypothetical protein